MTTQENQVQETANLEAAAEKPNMPMPVVRQPEQPVVEAPMTGEERDMLGHHEAVIQTASERILKGFVEIGEALMAIKNGRLWRDHYASFDDYCQRRWSHSGRRGEQLITAVQVYFLIEEQAPHLTRYLDNPATAEALGKAPDDKKQEVLKEAVAEAHTKGEKKPTAETIKKHADAHKTTKGTSGGKRRKAKTSYEVSVTISDLNDAPAIREIFRNAELELTSENPKATRLVSPKADQFQTGKFLVAFGAWLAAQPVKDGLILAVE